MPLCGSLLGYLFQLLGADGTMGFFAQLCDRFCGNHSLAPRNKFAISVFSHDISVDIAGVPTFRYSPNRYRSLAVSSAVPVPRTRRGLKPDSVQVIRVIISTGLVATRKIPLKPDDVTGSIMDLKTSVFLLEDSDGFHLASALHRRK